MSIGFSAIQDSTIVFRHKCVYKQSTGYKRGDKLYIKVCGGFVRMRENGDTSHPDVVWIETDIDGVEVKGRSGKYVAVKNESE
jgi:hypothetical protein